MWYDKKPAITWKQLPADLMMQRLTVPEGVIDMVLDTDTYNEVDDQFALAYALLSPERLNVEAVYAAPFFNDRSNGPEQGMERSYDEILRLLEKLHHSSENFAFRGSPRYMDAAKTPIESDAVRDLIARAMARPMDRPLYVVAIGAITNVASAILLEPAITEKIVLVWLGGQPSTYTNTNEFNLSQDPYAAQVIFDCGVPLMRVPCMGVSSHMLTSIPELQYCLGGKNALCDMLLDIVRGYPQDDFAWGKEIWDVSTIGFLMNPDWVPTKLVHSPILTDDYFWAHDERRHFNREAYFCSRNPIFKDLFRKLAAFQDER
ncbi:MAG: nucleoside hydrolase [Ruminococcaceae bacterium]|nr:nucleoside hydrolase [Oscillospiraceae bacterium]